MLRLIYRALTFFCRREDPSEQNVQQLSVLKDDSKLKTLQGVVTKLCDDHGLINKLIYFTSDVVTDNVHLKVGQKVTAIVKEGFEPYEGDWIEVEFSLQPDTWSRKAISVKPRRHKHVNEVCITSLCGRNGVIGDNIFFTLDSLKLPDGYIPQISDIVNAVVVERVHSTYIWRALSMTL
ncbi:cancer/testis antigen 55, partial [Orycteropus afer afer]|uniref:Cancer/testis antigen 55 n=1 Tax=Orycteropus afer afer TaxID=1230840 RepID=A0AC54Z5D4_ORYAF